MKPFPQIFALHYLFTKKPDKVVAHCLDLDLVVEGKDEDTAEERLNTVVRAQFAQAARTGNLAMAYFPAPVQFWAELKRATALPPKTLTIETPPMVLQVEQAVVAEMPVLRAEVMLQAAQMPLLADVLKSNGVAIVGRQELANGEWLLLIGPPGAVSYPTPLYPCYILYAETRDPADVSDDIAAAIHRRFHPPLLSAGFTKSED